MKKLIALAVAAASMPAMAAVSISGASEFSFSDKDGASGTTAGMEQTVVTVSGSSEMDNGMTISASSSMLNDGADIVSDNGATSITIAGSFGKLNLGDVAGPLDALDGAAIGTAENDFSNGQGGDMSVRYDLPTIAEGLTLHVGYSPENGGDGVVADTSGFGASYSAAGFKVFYGSEDNAAGNEVTGYGASYTMGGLTVGYNASETDGGKELSGVAAGYKTGNLTLAVNTTEDDTVADSEQMTVSVAYSMGGGVTVYAASTSRDDGVVDANSAHVEDENTVGIKFSF